MMCSFGLACLRATPSPTSSARSGSRGCERSEHGRSRLGLDGREHTGTLRSTRASQAVGRLKPREGGPAAPGTVDRLRRGPPKADHQQAGSPAKGRDPPKADHQPTAGSPARGRDPPKADHQPTAGSPAEGRITAEGGSPAKGWAPAEGRITAEGGSRAQPVHPPAPAEGGASTITLSETWFRYSSFCNQAAKLQPLLHGCQDQAA
jgi:hypothetical protein